MNRIILGLIEEVTLLANVHKSVKARIDTGATTSSINIELAKNLALGPITRTKIVKSASGTHKRPMLRAKVRIAGQEIEDEFTLANRTHMTYPVLIGQNILKKGNFLIDPLK